MNNNNFVITQKGIEAINTIAGGNVFPLQTNQSLAERWGVTKQNIYAWSRRHDDFPKPIEGVIDRSTKVYPMYEVERYEKLRGLNKVD